MNPNLFPILKAFAIGDALGEPFESSSPTQVDIENRWHAPKRLSFTDDSFLALSSGWSLSKCASQKPRFWDRLKLHTCEFLIEWFKSGDFRGMGFTTHSALKQMKDAHEWGEGLDRFEICDRGYDFAISAGNGVLSRSLPIFLTGPVDVAHLVNWLKLTHLHPHGHESAKNLALYLERDREPPAEPWSDGRGFYAPETLHIAVSAVRSATSPFEAFALSQRDGGDNDSTAALALALWVHRHGWCGELERLYGQMIEDDREIIETSLNGSDLKNIFLL